MKMIYMDNAATSWPKPDIVYDTILRTMKYYGANPGRSSHTMAIEAANILLYTREMLCQLFNAQDPFRMIFTQHDGQFKPGYQRCIKRGSCHYHLYGT